MGAFAEYVGACANLLLKLPDDMSFEQGASFGVGVATSIIGLFGELQIPVTLEHLAAVQEVPESCQGEFILVAGGSTASGTRALQLLRLYVQGQRPYHPRHDTNTLRTGLDSVL